MHNCGHANFCLVTHENIVLILLFTITICKPFINLAPSNSQTVVTLTDADACHICFLKRRFENPGGGANSVEVSIIYPPLVRIGLTYRNWDSFLLPRFLRLCSHICRLRKMAKSVSSSRRFCASTDTVYISRSNVIHPT